MPTPEASTAYYAQQQRLTVATLLLTRREWDRMSAADLDGSWRTVGPRLTLTVLSAQLGAARAAEPYLTRVLDELQIADEPVASLAPRAFVGVTGDGRPVESLLYGAVTTAKTAAGNGASTREMLAAGRGWLDMAVQTTLADTGRQSVSAGMTARPAVRGWVRQLNPPSCSRCAVLAGKFFKWNQGFQRHPRCDCRHIPADEDVAGDLTTDPRRYFDSLAAAEQDRLFTQAGAQAIRDGADIGQVVNARRGARGMAPAGARLTADEIRMLRGGRGRGRLEPTRAFGRDLFITTEGTTVRGVSGQVIGQRAGATATADRAAGDRYRRARAPRLMPESIYQVAGGSRDEAIRLLRLNGYLT